MTDSETATTDEWGSMVEDFNAAVMRAVEDNVSAQAAIAESWMASLGDSTADAVSEDAVAGYARAYETWMDAAKEGFERASDALDGEDVPPEEFRDIWLNAANDAFKDVMSTTAFAAATGDTVGDVLGLADQMDDATARALHNAGLPTADDIQEVGERLVELERRQHAVEGQLERLDELDRLSEMDTQLDRLEDLDQQIAHLEQTELGELDRLSAMDDKLDRLEAVDDKLDRLEEMDGKLDRIEEVDERLDRLEAVDEKLDRLEAMDDKLDRIEEVDDKLDRLVAAAEEEDENE